MKPLICYVVGAGVFVTVLIFPNRAEARGRGIPVPIPVFYGWGEEIAHVRDLPSDVKEAAGRELKHDVAVGYAYKRFHVYWIDLWTWGGRHVLYDKDMYWELDSYQWDELLGSRESARLYKPVRYTFPPGGSVIFGLVILWSAAKFRRLLRPTQLRPKVPQMPQLVGNYCVLCQQRIVSTIEGKFCGACGSPVHLNCIDLSRKETSLCPECGGDPSSVKPPEYAACNRIPRTG